MGFCKTILQWFLKEPSTAKTYLTEMKEIKYFVGWYDMN